MKFRLAVLEDLNAIAKLFHDCWHISYADLLSDEVRETMTLDSAADLWRPGLVEPNERETLVGVDSGEIVSVFRIGADKDNPARGHLFSLYVAPTHSGKGIGKDSLAAAIDRIAEKGYSNISLWVFEGNERAKSLYRRAGFAETGRTRRDERWRELEIEMAASLT